jgi:hypothetical protein
MNQRERSDLDRHITGNYGEDHIDESDIVGPLAAECAGILLLWGAFAEKHGPDHAAIYDADGDSLFMVTTSINRDDLNTMFNVRRQAEMRGEKIGEEKAHTTIKRALGL